MTVMEVLDLRQPRRATVPGGGGAGPCDGSERAAVREPNALVAQVGLLGQKVVVAVVVEDPELVGVRDRGDDHIDRRQAVLTDVRELALRIERALLDLLIDANPREREQIADQRDVVSAASRRVASLERLGIRDKGRAVLSAITGSWSSCIPWLARPHAGATRRRMK